MSYEKVRRGWRRVGGGPESLLWVRIMRTLEEVVVAFREVAAGPLPRRVKMTRLVALKAEINDLCFQGMQEAGVIDTGHQALEALLLELYNHAAQK